MEYEVIYCGTILKLSNGFFRTYKKRWLVFKQHIKTSELCLEYGVSENDVHPRGTYQINKNCILNTNIVDGSKRKFFLLLAIDQNTTLEFQALSFKEFDEWVNAFNTLGIVGKKMIQNRKKSNVLTSTDIEVPTTFGKKFVNIETHDVIYWDLHSVLEWLDIVLFLEDKSDVKSIKDIFTEKHVNGRELEGLDENIMMELMIPHHMIMKINNPLQELKKTRSFDFCAHKVALKLKKQADTLKVPTKSDQILRIAANLSSVEGLKRSYLNCEDDSVQNLIKTLRKEDMDDETLEFDGIEKVITEAKVKVKLVITNIDTNDTFRRVLSPVIGYLNPKSLTYGLFHTAIIVGPFYLEFTDSGLCIPRKIMKSNKSFVSLDLGEIEIKSNDFGEIVDPLSIIISEYNVNYQYARQKTVVNTASCQDFVEAVLQGLNISFKPIPGGCIENFLRLVKNQGVHDPILIPCEKFCKEFESGTSISFLSHFELDTFVTSIQKKDLMYKDHFPEEYKLLKAFDRGFWLKYQAELAKPDSQLIPIYEPLHTEISACCPFEDPFTSGSFIKLEKK